MGCFLSSKTYIEEKIEECERYLTLSKKSINEIKQAFFLLNEGEFISQKALQKALFNLNLQYSEKIVDFIVYPFFQSLAFIKNKDNTNKGELIEINKKKEIIEKDNIFILEEELKEFLLIPLKREYFEFNKIISVFYMLSNEKSLVKAIDLFKLFKKLGKKKMDKIEIENFLKYLFETVAVYSLVFAEIKPRLIDKICKNIAENVFFFFIIYKKIFLIL